MSIPARQRLALRIFILRVRRHVVSLKNPVSGVGSLTRADFKMLDIPKEALFLAGKVFLQYGKNKGTQLSPLPDFFIGAHAAVLNFGIITRDAAGYRTYFPTVNLINP